MKVKVQRPEIHIVTLELDVPTGMSLTDVFNAAYNGEGTEANSAYHRTLDASEHMWVVTDSSGNSQIFSKEPE